MDIDRFTVLKKKGEDGASSPRLGIREPYDYLALLMKDGSSMRVPSKDPEPAAEALRLTTNYSNSFVDSLHPIAVCSTYPKWGSVTLPP